MSNISYDKDGNIIGISFGWSAKDVEWVSKQKLTPEEISEVLYLCDKHYDNVIGFSWDTLSYWVGEVLEKEKIKMNHLV